jgi:hypothetical protein
MEECVRRHRDRGILHFGISSELRLGRRRSVNSEVQSEAGSVGVAAAAAPEDGQRMHSLKVSGDLAGYIRPQPITF